MPADAVCREAIKIIGGPSALSRKLGVYPSAITQWKRVPAKWVPTIAALSGIPPEQLRPDIYRLLRRA